MRARFVLLILAFIVILGACGAAFAYDPDDSPSSTTDLTTIGRPEGTVTIKDVSEDMTVPSLLRDTSRDQAPAPAPRFDGPEILKIDVQGNSTVVTDYVLSVVTSKVGTPVDENRLSKDADAIYDLGFFSAVDYKLEDEPNGVNVTFVVTENPVVEDINFFGNTVYSSQTLKDLCFTKPGMVFNRVFFRNDLQRIKEKYQQDGYVMARVSDVKIDGQIVNVYITEPKLGSVVVQGNKRTKSYVITRQINIKSGDLFNATKLRYTLNRLQGLGYFDDVSVGFEPSDDPDTINLILSVTEAKTGRIGISIGYGTQSGWGGGISYSDSNWKGLGHKFSVGFELGDREQYWFSYEQPYMDSKTFAWRFGAYKRSWDDLSYYERDVYQFDYDEEVKGAYIGFGRTFSEKSKLSWYLTTEWQDISITPHADAYPTPHQLEEMQAGQNFVIGGVIQRNNMDVYSPYPKGDVEEIHIDQGLDVLGGDWSYTKYWFEARYYTAIDMLTRIFERSFEVDDIPPIFAARLRVGSSSGYLPWAVDYTLGGDNTLRGYDDKYFRGDEMFLLNLEYRMPVQKNFSLVLFYDLGKAWDTSIGEKFDLGDLASGYGIGVRVKTPLGNLRLDFAQGDDESRVHFGFGEMF